MAIDPRVKAFRDLVDNKARLARPDRYPVKPDVDDGEEPRDWRDDLADELADEVPATTARQLYIRKYIEDRESVAIRRANTFLRTLKVDTDQYALPVDWYLFDDDPVSVEVPITDEAGNDTGRTRVERVALRAMWPADLLAWESQERDRAKKDYETRMDTCDGVHWLALNQGSQPFRSWATEEQPPPPEWKRESAS